MLLAISISFLFVYLCAAFVCLYVCVSLTGWSPSRYPPPLHRSLLSFGFPESGQNPSPFPSLPFPTPHSYVCVTNIRPSDTSFICPSSPTSHRSSRPSCHLFLFVFSRFPLAWFSLIASYKRDCSHLFFWFFSPPQVKPLPPKARLWFLFVLVEIVRFSSHLSSLSQPTATNTNSIHKQKQRDKEGGPFGWTMQITNE